MPEGGDDAPLQPSNSKSEELHVVMTLSFSCESQLFECMYFIWMAGIYSLHITVMSEILGSAL